MENRQTIDTKYTWSIDDMFTEESFTACLDQVKKQVEAIKVMRGTLTLEPTSLIDVLVLKDDLSMNLSDLFTYAHMKLDENTKDASSSTRFERANAAVTEAQAAMAFIEPELLSLDRQGLVAVFKDTPALKPYDHMLHELLRQEAHVLTPEKEELLAMMGDVAGSPQAAFNMLNNADITFEPMAFEDGTSAPLTKSSYIKFLEDDKQEVRKQAFDRFYKAYEALKNTITSTYTSSVKKDIALAKIRNYPTAVDMALSADNIGVDVYDNLVAEIRNQVGLMHRYVGLRKRMLGVDNLHIYDVYAPLVSEAKREIPYDQAYDMVVKGLAPLGEDYAKLLNQCLQERWIDVYETEGKRAGAYSWGTYRSKPFILLNYQHNLNDVFTLAHELGHSMHSYYSRQAQPYAKADYSLFVAEVASTVNEAIMMRYLLKATQDKQEKLYLLNHFMEQFKGTVFRQTMFAEFERCVHTAYENNNPMSVDDLSAYYYGLNQAYFGKDMELDQAIKYEWMRIPHFYSAFYVYKYATGFSAAMAISKRILDGEPGALDGYFDFLKCGGSLYPLDALKLAGVDMSSPQPIKEALTVFKEVMDEFESLIG